MGTTRWPVRRKGIERERERRLDRGRAVTSNAPPPSPQFTTISLPVSSAFAPRTRECSHAPICRCGSWRSSCVAHSMDAARCLETIPLVVIPKSLRIYPRVFFFLLSSVEAEATSKCRQYIFIYYLLAFTFVFTHSVRPYPSLCSLVDPTICSSIQRVVIV